MLHVSRSYSDSIVSNGPIDDPFAITEDGILQFCFAERPDGVSNDTPRQIELYSAKLSPHFARRFLEVCR